MSHNYPSIMFSYWERVSTIVYGFLRKEINEVHSRPWKGPVGNTMGVVGERVLTAAIKVWKVFFFFFFFWDKHFK